MRFQHTARSLLSVFGVLPAQNPPKLIAFPTPRAFFFIGFWCFSRYKSLRLFAFPTPRAFFAFEYWGFTCHKSPQVGCLPNLPALSFLSVFWVFTTPIPTRWLPSQATSPCLLFDFGVYLPQISPLSCPPKSLRFLCFLFLGFYPPQITQVGCFSNTPKVVGVLPATNLRRFLSIPPPPPALSLLYVFWVLPDYIPQVGCLSNPPRNLCFQFLGLYPPPIPPGLVAFPTDLALFAFWFWGLPLPNLLRWLTSQPPALSWLSVFAVCTRPKLPRLVAFPIHLALFPFLVLRFYPAQLHGRLPSKPLTLSLLFVSLGYIITSNSPA